MPPAAGERHGIPAERSPLITREAERATASSREGTTMRSGDITSDRVCRSAGSAVSVARERYGTGPGAVAVERPGGVVGLLPGWVTVGCVVGRTVWVGVWVAAGLVGSTVGTGAWVGSAVTVGALVACDVTGADVRALSSPTPARLGKSTFGSPSSAPLGKESIQIDNPGRSCGQLVEATDPGQRRRRAVDVLIPRPTSIAGGVYPLNHTDLRSSGGAGLPADGRPICWARAPVPPLARDGPHRIDDVGPLRSCRTR
ncbi:MAG: hypothetical protein IPM08_15165 [Actinomycetales bacterium]|nr:hypothetical protein [Actinomycetales bacterium]